MTDALFKQFPTAPLYQINEEVYLMVAGQSQPTGPYLISAVLASQRYSIKRKDNGEQLPQSIKEEDLVVRVS